jgi:hypothetical protein
VQSRTVRNIEKIYLPRVGRTATHDQVQIFRFRFCFAILLGLSVATGVSAPAVGSTLALEVALSLSGLAFSFLGITMHYRRQFNRHASESIGVSLDWRHDIPIEKSKYEEWCRKNNTTPYQPMLD